MVEVNPEVLTSLGRKLDQLDLTETEQAVLDHILDRAEAFEPEVAGFAQMNMQFMGFKSGAELAGTGYRLGAGLGVVGGGPSSTTEMEFGREGPDTPQR